MTAVLWAALWLPPVVAVVAVVAPWVVGEAAALLDRLAALAEARAAVRYPARHLAAPSGNVRVLRRDPPRWWTTDAPAWALAPPGRPELPPALTPLANAQVAA